MKRHRMMIVQVAVASAFIGVTGFVSPAEATSRLGPAAIVRYADAVPGIAPADIGNRASYVDEHGRKISPMTSGTTGSGSVARRSSCQPISLPDNPHYSSPDVS